MSDTHYHGKEISADTYATLRRHPFNPESLGDRLQRMENVTVTMKEKCTILDLLIADSTKDCLKEPKLTSNTKFYTTVYLGAWYIWDRILQTSLEAQEKYESDFQMKLDGVYHPLNDGIGWLTTCMEEMRQDIASIQQATDASRHTSIDRRHHESIDSRLPTSIDQRLPALVDNNPPHSPPMNSQQDFHTREEIDQLEPKLTSNTKLDTTACLGAWYTWDRILQTSLEGKGLEHDMVATTIKACFTNNPRI
ncbi:hypothetical protein F2Q70_00022984 [Brassica cretica]|uniref:Uncharacterized protein n=1 Tax=Brassica cretica TaxID=69181 RepID=A0A8S9GX45_BRACR|nr:hypothetical protein F2Q70_00022984 [Brassica cretica]